MPVTLVSWNLQGHSGPDVRAAAAELRHLSPDVVVLQEVQWHHARHVRRALGARSGHWSFKHWPLRTWPEGSAVIGVTRRVRVRTRSLSHGWRLWSWRRRIAQIAAVRRSRDGGGPFTVANVHLSPHDQPRLRLAETQRLLRLVRRSSGPVVVVGDLNERPGGPLHRALAAAGFRDASGVAHGDAPPPGADPPPDPVPTNWHGWRAGTPAPPTQQLDYVYLSPGAGVIELRVPRVGDDGFDRYRVLSDHLPVTAVLELG
ncbi:MAG TPA: endonuclease/exonuclease/phosphatase family protein [Acidimicrobiales bacterium]